MEVTLGYRQTDIGIMPNDWELKTLEHIVASAGLVRGPFGGALKKDSFVRRGYKVYEQRNAIYRTTEKGEYYIDAQKFKDLVRFRVRPGDLIVSCSGTIGCIYRIPNNAPDGVINQALLKIALNSDLIDDSYFLSVFRWQPFQERITDNSHGGAMQNLVGMDVFRKTLIPLPSYHEQKAISEALSDADALIETLEQLVAKKRQIKQGTMQKLMCPKRGWIASDFDSIAKQIVGGGTPSRSVPHFWNGNVPWMTVKDFATYSPTGTIEYITHAGLKNSASHLIPKHTVIISTRMAIGKAVMFDIDVAINQDLKAIFPIKEIDSTFLLYWFQFNEAEISALGSGSTVMGISLNDLRKMPFAIPPLSEQHSTIILLADMDAEIGVLEAKLDKVRQLKQGMMHELLTGRIRLI